MSTTFWLALMLAALMVLNGCVPGGMFMADPATMSPEQMKEFKALGYDAIRCATVTGGPPVGGTVTSVTVPKDRTVTVKFIGCQVQSIEVGGPK